MARGIGSVIASTVEVGSPARLPAVSSGSSSWISPAPAIVPSEDHPRWARDGMGTAVAQVAADPPGDRPDDHRHDEGQHFEHLVQAVDLDLQVLGQHVVRSREHQQHEERDPSRPDGAAQGLVARALRVVVQRGVASHACLDERPEPERGEDDAGDHDGRQEQLADRVPEEVELPVRPEPQDALEPSRVETGCAGDGAE